ncbi:MAG TPA: PAS domain-containing sensor histidine kinase [Methanomicrobiales archaeon]|nr:PAS domain-containing sensor histidine kinase [Methanomicrobiales archaeon]
MVEDARGFLEGLPFPAMTLDAGGVVTSFNSRFSELLGGDPADLAGSGGFRFVEPGDRELVRSLVTGMACGSSIALIASFRKMNGGRVKVQGFWAASGPSPATPSAYLGLFLEMPAGDSPAQPGARSGGVALPLSPTIPSSDTAGGGVVLREQVIHTIVFHDAKNRLMALHGYADLLRESLAGSGFLGYIDKLEEIASEIERDLKVASMFSHLGLIAPLWQNLREVIGRAAPREPEGRVLADQVPATLWCFADPLFSRVFSNLFENSRRHGEGVTRIRVGAAEKDTGLVISIEDDGVGVPAEQKERIFELGFGRHTGYGLCLAREVLSISGFSIREAGEPGKGARFEIHVPRGKYLLSPSRPEEADPIRIPAA